MPAHVQRLCSLLPPVPAERYPISDGKIVTNSVILFLKVPHTYLCAVFDNAARIRLISIPLCLSFCSARSFSFVVCLSLFSSLAWTNIFVRILFWVSLLVSTFPLPWSETAGETEGKRESEREQINCIISAYKLNPRHKCSGEKQRSVFLSGKRKGREGRRRMSDRHKEIKVERWSHSAGVRSEEKKGEGVMESERAEREVDRCPVRVQWSGVFNLTWWTSHWKHHPLSSSFNTAPSLKSCDEVVFKVI